MKKIASLLLLALTLPFLACCEDDTDSNPVLQHPASFVLNVPPFAANNVYDLENSKSVELTCTQPAYGFTAATNYAVQVTLDEAFTEATDEAEANYVELSTFYTTARMDVDAYELNSAIISLWEKAHPNDELPADVAVTLRLRAYIASTASRPPSRCPMCMLYAWLLLWHCLRACTSSAACPPPRTGASG